MQKDYVAGFMYVDQEFQSFSHPQGRVNKVVGGTRNEYFLRDHLGNTRVVYSDLNNNGVIELDTLMENCELLEEYYYYPFGMEMEMWWSKQKDTITLNRDRYNGKEQQRELGWDWYNYGARFYDASVGRWNAVDPLADEFNPFSPYAYVLNNPLSTIDPTGRESKSVHDMIEEVWDATPEGEERTFIFGNENQADEDCCPYGDPPAIEANNAKALGLSLDEYRNTVNLPSQVTNEQLLEGALWMGTGLVTGLAVKSVIKLTQWALRVPSAAKGVKMYSEATFKSFEKQLLEGGRDRLLTSRTTIQKNLTEHVQKLEAAKKAGGYTSSIEREIKTFQSQLDAISDLLK